MQIKTSASRNSKTGKKYKVKVKRAESGQPTGQGQWIKPTHINIGTSHPLGEFLQILDNVPAHGMDQVDITYVYTQAKGLKSMRNVQASADHAAQPPKEHSVQWS